MSSSPAVDGGAVHNLPCRLHVTAVQFYARHYVPFGEIGDAQVAVILVVQRRAAPVCVVERVYEGIAAAVELCFGYSVLQETFHLVDQQPVAVGAVLRSAFKREPVRDAVEIGDCLRVHAHRIEGGVFQRILQPAPHDVHSYSREIVVDKGYGSVSQLAVRQRHYEVQGNPGAVRLLVLEVEEASSGGIEHRVRKFRQGSVRLGYYLKKSPYLGFYGGRVNIACYDYGLHVGPAPCPVERLDIPGSISVNKPEQLLLRCRRKGCAGVVEPGQRVFYPPFQSLSGAISVLEEVLPPLY